MTHEPDIVATPWGPMDRLDASYRVLRDMITIHESIVARNDAAESKLAEAIAKMDEARKLRDGALDLIHRLDAYIARQEQRKADEAAAREAQEREQLEDPLEEPGAQGELSPIPAKEPADAYGDLPEELKLRAPPEPGNYAMPDPEDLDLPPEPPEQPVAISLNKGD